MPSSRIQCSFAEACKQLARNLSVFVKPRSSDWQQIFGIAYALNDELVTFVTSSDSDLEISMPADQHASFYYVPADDK